MAGNMRGRTCFYSAVEYSEFSGKYWKAGSKRQTQSHVSALYEQWVLYSPICHPTGPMGRGVEV